MDLNRSAGSNRRSISSPPRADELASQAKALNSGLDVRRSAFDVFCRKQDVTTVPDQHGHFGPYGGMFVPETLVSALNELATEYERAKRDPAFRTELGELLRDFAGRPTPLYFAERLTAQLGGARIYLKREDLLHTGAHKINNALGQILLARRMPDAAVRTRATTLHIAFPLPRNVRQTGREA